MSSSTEVSRPAGENTGRGRSRVLGLALGGVLVLAGGSYAAGYALAGDKLPRDARVSGVALGGVEQDEAVQRLQTALGPKADAPITLAAQKKKATITPAAAGLGIDYQATVRQAGAGRSWRPTHIWNVLRGGGELSPVLVRDQAKLSAAVNAAAPSFASRAVDATVALKGSTPVSTPGQQAVALDTAAATKLVGDAYLHSTSVPAPLTRTDPALTTQEASQATAKLTSLVSAPVVLTTSKGKLTVPVPDIAAATTVAAKDGAFSVSTDTKKLYQASADDRRQLGLVGGKDARVQLVGGKPTVVPSTDGQGISEADFTKAVTPALTAGGAKRTVPVTVTKAPASYTTADAQKAGVKEVTGEFTTHFPYAEYRNTNLSLAAASINNSYVQPGKTFSLNDTLGPKGPGSGYVDGWVITGDHLTQENAGGVSQSATTTFNAIFFAGLQDVEHHPHTMYFDRYPAGREATLYYGHLDLKFRNDTPHGVLLQASVSKAAPGGQGSITVKVWSTKVYDVTSSELVKSNFTTGRTMRGSGESCHAQAASPGFTVNYSRIFSKDGAVVRREPFRWTYSPTDQIICS